MTPADPLAPFMPSILADPASDAPRLVAADYLTDLAHARGEEDDPRAEFIRVQVELDAFPHVDAVRGGEYDARDGVSPEWQRAFDLHDRERELLAGHGLAWFPPELMALESERAGGVCTYRRGFVASLTLPFRDWITHAEALRAAVPIERVAVTGVEPTGPILGGPQIGWWFWLRRDLPEAVWDKLPHDRKGVAAVYCEYPTRPLALSALAAACGECWPGVAFTVGGVTP